MKKRWLWLIEGEPQAIVLAWDEDEADGVVLRQREKDQAALYGRTEPNDEDKEEAARYHEERDVLLSLDDPTLPVLEEEL